MFDMTVFDTTRTTPSRTRPGRQAFLLGLSLAITVLISSCTNDPAPGADTAKTPPSTAKSSESLQGTANPGQTSPSAADGESKPATEVPLAIQDLQKKIQPDPATVTAAKKKQKKPPPRAEREEGAPDAVHEEAADRQRRHKDTDESGRTEGGTDRRGAAETPRGHQEDRGSLGERPRPR